MEKTKEEERREVLEHVRDIGIALHGKPDLALEFVQRILGVKDVEKADVFSIEVNDLVATITFDVVIGGMVKKLEFGILA